MLCKETIVTTLLVQVIRAHELLQATDWTECDVPLCSLKIEEDGVIEDSGAACAHVS